MCPSAPERLPIAERCEVMCVLCGYAVRARCDGLWRLWSVPVPGARDFEEARTKLKRGPAHSSRAYDTARTQESRSRSSQRYCYCER